MATRARGAGAKRKPTALKMLEGNRSKLKHPFNLHEPRPRRCELPIPPDYLNDVAREEWERIAPEVWRLGLLTVADVHTLAAYCQAFGKWVQAERALARMSDEPHYGLVVRGSTGSLITNPLFNAASKASQEMMRYATEFGLTPSARARLDGIGIEEPTSKFDGLLQA